MQCAVSSDLIRTANNRSANEDYHTWEPQLGLNERRERARTDRQHQRAQQDVLWKERQQEHRFRRYCYLSREQERRQQFQAYLQAEFASKVSAASLFCCRCNSSEHLQNLLPAVPLTPDTFYLCGPTSYCFNKTHSSNSSTIHQPMVTCGWSNLALLMMQVVPQGVAVNVRNCIMCEVKLTPEDTCDICAPASYSFDPTQ